jgi:hypothetical protein
MSSLPIQLDYSQAIGEIPECQNYEVCLTPATGATNYAPGGVIRFDFQNRGMIDPSSITLRYKYSLTAAVGAQMIGTPAYTPFLRLETLIGSQVVESINQYNQVAGFLHANTNLDIGQKYGQFSPLGYFASTGTPSLEQMDGRICVGVAGQGVGGGAAIGETGTFSAPLVGLLSSAGKLIPAFAMPQISVQLTIDSIANIFTTAVTPTAFQLSNVELCYNMLDFGRSMEAQVLAMPKLFLKCNSYSNSSASVATATNGSISLVYNQKYASVKAAYVLPTGTSANSSNKWGDSYDMTSSNGEYSLVIAGVNYPQRPLSTLNNKTYIVQELRRASGNLDDKNNNMSINSVEFNYQGNDATTVNAPAKFIIGIPLEKLHIANDKAILSGVSTNNSNITVNISTATATAQAHTVNLILNYDCILEVDTQTRDARVRQ